MRNYNLTILTLPAALLAPSDLQDQLRIYDDDLQSSLLTSYIASAVEYIETQTSHVFQPVQYLMTMDRWPYLGYAAGPQYPTNGIVRLPRGPLKTVDLIQYIDTLGATQTMTVGTDYIVDARSKPARIWPPRFQYWPLTDIVQPNCVQITFTAGYASGSLIPERAKQAVRFIVSHWHANRVPFGDMTALRFSVPKTLETLVRSLRLW